MAVEQYRQIIQQLILERAKTRSPQEEIEKQAILDTERDHYLLLFHSPYMRQFTEFATN